MSSRTSHPFIVALAVLSLFCVASSRTVRAQDASGWVMVAPNDESFSVSLPSEPSVKSQSALPTVGSPAGRVYTSKRDSAEFRVWSLKSEQAMGDDALSISDFLDSCAEMAWTLVVAPELESAMRAGSRDAFVRYSMSYQLSTTLGTTQHAYYARQYSVALGASRGGVYLFADGANAYVALAIGRGAAGEADVRTFLNSFTVHAPGGTEIKMPSTDAAPTATTGIVTGVGPGRGGNVGDAGVATSVESAPASCDDLSKRVFSPGDATRKARILARPEPTYTEWARKLSVTGTLRLRGVLGADGEVTNVVAVTQLPHGLTRKALEAFHAVRFEPAEKDGCKVSQYVTIDYNFNIY